MHNNFKGTDLDSLINKLYFEFPAAKKILLEHSRQVAAMALDINDEKNLGLDPGMIQYAAMAHDIGIVFTDAPGIGCYGCAPYICHGVLGGDALRGNNAPEWAARVAERHTGAGLTQSDIAIQNLPLPAGRCLMPESLLEKLICYADKFYSKRPGHLNERSSIEKVRTSMLKHGTDALNRFEVLHSLFGKEQA